MIAAVDAASVAIDLKDFISSESLAEILQTLFTDLVKAVQVMQNHEDGLNLENVNELLTTTATSFIKLVVSKVAEGGLTATIGRFSKGAAKTLAKVIDITGKLSAIEQSLERTAGYTLPNALAVERAVVVIGDPFNPVIDRVWPNVAQEGERVAIYGRNFGFPLEAGEYTADPNEDISACFCQFAQTTTDPENQTSDTSLEAEILQRTNTQIVVTVPDDFEAAFHEGVPVYICMNKKGRESNSRGLGTKGEFQLPEPPEILSVAPEKVLPGSFVAVTGQRFGGNAVAILDGGAPIIPVRIEDRSMILNLAATAAGYVVGEHSLKVKRGTLESPAFPFVIEQATTPPPGSPLPAGWTITVTQLSMTNSPDGEISFLEAMRLANGSLGRPLEFHHPCEDIPLGETGYCGGFRQREEDFVFFQVDEFGNPFPCGPDYKDTIRITSALSGGTVFVSGSGLPPVGNEDILKLNEIILDGTDALGESHGLLLDGASHAKIEEVTLQNWPGDGLHLANDSTGNDLDHITIENIGGNGIGLFNNASGNDFNHVTILGTGEHGIFIEGDSVENTFTHADQDTSDPDAIQNLLPNISHTGGHGVYLTGRANRNAFVNCFIDQAGGSGILLEGDAQENHFDQMVVTRPALNGLHLSGGMVRYNRAFKGTLVGLHGTWEPRDIYHQAGGYGILIENGAHTNLLGPRWVFDNALGGIRLDGAGTDNNFVGRKYRYDPESTYDYQAEPSLVYNCGGHGIHISGGASGNSLELLNVAGNAGDGVLIEGAETTRNRVSGVWTGFQYFVYGTGTEPFPKPNSGNGIHLAEGANGNVIGGFSVSRNNFSLDLENGVLIEGSETTENVVRDTDIGRRRTSEGVTGGKFVGVGKSGIALINGAHGNVIGSEDVNNRVHIDACPEAGILIDGTDHHLIVGCFLGYPNESITY